MATRGLIGYLDTNGDLKLTTTYSNYDSYPGNLGKGLETFYNSDAKAEEIANVGYISFLDGETGEWDAKHKQNPRRNALTDDFNEAMLDIASEIDSSGADYGYIWDNENEEWITVRNFGINSMASSLEKDLAHLKYKFNIKTQDMNENVDVKGHVMMLLSKVKSQLEPEEKNMFNTYEESVMRDVKAGGSRLDQYLDFDVDDMMEDYKNYISGRVDFNESFINEMKYRAGIIK
jgi:hypothetical protein